MNANSKWCQWPIRESRFSFAPNLFRWWQEFLPIHRVKLSKSSPITQLVILTSLEIFLRICGMFTIPKKFFETCSWGVQIGEFLQSFPSLIPRQMPKFYCGYFAFWWSIIFFKIILYGQANFVIFISGQPTWSRPRFPICVLQTGVV